ncbi:MAG: hypothetical protein LQ339_005252 [Xanthoria mediterranea]|nr:MAG: hypothetical protein LQ339_005252 [Xanthoria mediterranea]
MGETLVKTIPTDPDEYQKWLKSQRDFYAKWDDSLHTFLSITPHDLQHIETRFWEMGHHETDPILEEAFSNKLTAFPNHHPTEYHFWAKYSCTIDLDLEVFSIDNGAHYRLDAIPRNRQWIKALLFDSKGHPFVHPQLAPEASMANLAANTQQSVTERSTTFPRKEVVPKVPDASNMLAKFQLKLFNVFQQDELDCLPVTVLSWKAGDLAFREFAFHILCLALGGSYLAIIDDSRTIGPSLHGQLDPVWTKYRALIHGNDSDGERELLTSLGLGFHMEDEPLGTAPQASKYWLEGVLVCLVPRLEQPNVALYAMTEAVEYGRDVCGHSSFDAVLISIFDVILLKYSPNGTVNHSSPLPLVRVRDCLGLDAQQRYSDTWLDNALKRHQNTLCDPDESTIISPNDPEIQCLPNLVPDDVVETSFLRLVKFFDSTAIASIPGGSSACSLPPEVLSMILGFVCDTQTFIACTKVSRVFRELCQQRPLIMNDVVLTAPSQMSTDTDFRAVVLSSGEQMHISFSGQGGEDCESYRYLAGAQKNRKTVSREFLIHGLKLPRAFQIRLPRSDIDCEPDQITLIPGYGPWGEAAACSYLNKSNPDIRTLKDFWKVAAHLTIGHESALGSKWSNHFHPRVADCLLPPNSQHYFISTDRNSDHIYYRHYLMLMIKRGSRYWGCLWDDIIREAKEELVKVDDAEDFRRLDEDGHEIVRTPRSVGAANPSVILTVGLEVRLFEWRQSEDLSDANPHYDGMLTETEPGKVLSILNAEDREAIEVVLRAAVQRLQDAPKRDRSIGLPSP